MKSGNFVTIKTVMLGDTFSGKTALVSRFADNIFPTQYEPTLVDFKERKVKIEDKQIQFQIFDISGSERYNDIKDSYLPQLAQFVIITCDLTNARAGEKIKEKYLPRIQALAKRKPVVFLVGTKADEVRGMSDDEFDELADELQLSYAILSAKDNQVKGDKNNQGVEALFIKAAKLILPTLTLENAPDGKENQESQSGSDTVSAEEIEIETDLEDEKESYSGNDSAVDSKWSVNTITSTTGPSKGTAKSTTSDDASDKDDFRSEDDSKDRFQSAVLKIKNFFERHWRKILLGIVIAVGAVAVGVFTAGIGLAIVSGAVAGAVAAGVTAGAIAGCAIGGAIAGAIEDRHEKAKLSQGKASISGSTKGMAKKIKINSKYTFYENKPDKSNIDVASKDDEKNEHSQRQTPHTPHNSKKDTPRPQ